MSPYFWVTLKFRLRGVPEYWRGLWRALVDGFRGEA